MSGEPAFTAEEYAARLEAVRARMAEGGLALCLISTPENIYYLTGLDHWGYFAPHMLVVPEDGEPVLVARAMERVTVENQARWVHFAGHDDQETPAQVTLRLIRDRGYAMARLDRASTVVAELVEERVDQRARIGIEKWSSGLPYGLAEALIGALPEADWIDITGLVDELRRIKSPAEQALLRAAARVSDAAMTAAIEAVREGASEREVAAACKHAMIRAGGTFPGFGPFVRSSARLGEEHTSWGDTVLEQGQAVFLELSGCVRRYHAPQGRLVLVGGPPPGAVTMAAICEDAFEAVLQALRPGALAREVYAAWQGVVDRAGLAHYRRHHCGYLVGIGFPPSWTGGNRVTGLRHDSDLEIRPGMSFHVLSWLMGTGIGDFFRSDTVLVGEDRPEVLTGAPAGVLVR